MTTRRPPTVVRWPTTRVVGELDRSAPRGGRLTQVVHEPAQLTHMAHGSCLSGSRNVGLIHGVSRGVVFGRSGACP